MINLQPLARSGPFWSLNLASVTKGSCDHLLRSVRTLQRELVATRPPSSAWLITVRWKIQAGTATGYLRLYGARLELVVRDKRQLPRYLNEYIRCIRSIVFSSDGETMEARTKRCFSCLVCPVQIIGLRNLKRHCFERHKRVPTEKRSQLSDEIFGLKRAQLRKLRPDSVDDVALCATGQHIYMRKLPTAERGANARSDNTAPTVRSAVVLAAAASKPLSKNATKTSRSKPRSCRTALPALNRRRRRRPQVRIAATRRRCWWGSNVPPSSIWSAVSAASSRITLDQTGSLT